MSKNRILSFSQAIHEAQQQSMELDKSVFIFGLGVDKTAHIFSTTKDLKKNLVKIEYLIHQLLNKH